MIAHSETKCKNVLNTEIMQSFREFVKEWEGYGQHAAPGKIVKIDQPGHEHHGKVGKVIRRQPTDAGVEIPGHSGLHWFNYGKLKST